MILTSRHIELFSILRLMKITDKEIRDRFILCINDIGETLEEIAGKLNTHKPYLSALKTNKTPKVPAVLIAKLCLEYGYSPHFIILGTGPRKAKAPRTKEDRLIEHNEKLLNVITDLLNEILILKPIWTDKTRQIAQEAKKNVQ